MSERPLLSSAVRRIVSSWRSRVPDEYGACHLVVSDFNVDDHVLGWVTRESELMGDEDCKRFVSQLGELEDGERLAAVLLLAGRSEESLLDE